MTTKNRTSGLQLALRTSVVSGMTLVSRILGLVRDIVFARYFGASLVMDAFLVAQRIPNMLRRFFAEGAFSAGFIPVMARYREKHDHEDAREFVDAIAGTFGIVLFLVTLVGVVASPLLVLIVAPGLRRRRRRLRSRRADVAIYVSLPVVRLADRVCRRHSQYLRAIRRSGVHTGDTERRADHGGHLGRAAARATGNGAGLRHAGRRYLASYCFSCRFSPGSMHFRVRSGRRTMQACGVPCT